MLLNSKLARRAPVTSWPGSRSSSSGGSPARVRDRTCEPRLPSQFSCAPSPVLSHLWLSRWITIQLTPLCRPLTTDWTRKSHFFRPVWPLSSKTAWKRASLYFTPARIWTVSLGELIYCPFSLHFSSCCLPKRAFGKIARSLHLNLCTIKKPASSLNRAWVNRKTNAAGEFLLP